MKLDKRIIEGKKPFDCVDAESETVKSFIGKEGYFANHISEFIDISDLEEDVLTGINSDDPDCEVYKATCTTWEYFLPKEWVKEPEKKYRPFSLEEFCKTFKVGDVVKLRKKDLQIAECAMFIGHAEYAEVNKPGANHITLGFDHYSLSSFFNNYELFIDGKWQPFGVEDVSE